MYLSCNLEWNQAVPLNGNSERAKNAASNLKGIEFRTAIGHPKSFAASNAQNQLAANARIHIQLPNSISCTKLPKITPLPTCIKSTKAKQNHKDGQSGINAQLKQSFRNWVTA
jgi:hypothetical protein